MGRFNNLVTFCPKACARFFCSIYISLTTYRIICFFLFPNFLQIVLWLVLWWKPIHVMTVLSKMFFAGCYFNSILCLLPYMLTSVNYFQFDKEMSFDRCFFICGPRVSSLWWKVTELPTLILE